MACGGWESVFACLRTHLLRRIIRRMCVDSQEEPGSSRLVLPCHPPVQHLGLRCRPTATLRHTLARNCIYCSVADLGILALSDGDYDGDKLQVTADPGLNIDCLCVCVCVCCTCNACLLLHACSRAVHVFRLKLLSPSFSSLWFYPSSQRDPLHMRPFALHVPGDCAGGGDTERPRSPSTENGGKGQHLMI